MVDQAYQRVNDYDLINRAVANRRVWVRLPDGVYYLATVRRGSTYLNQDEDSFSRNVEVEYANPDESTMVRSTENFRTDSIKIQQSEIVDFNTYLGNSNRKALELRVLVDQAYERVNDYDLINAALANRRVWVQLPDDVYYLATVRRGFVHIRGDENTLATHVEVEYANHEESTMVLAQPFDGFCAVENFRQSDPIMIQKSQIVDFNNFLEEERELREAVITRRDQRFEYDGAYLIGHFNPDNPVLVVLLNDPETDHPLITRAEWSMLQEYLRKETVARERALSHRIFRANYEVFANGNDVNQEMYNAHVFPAHEEERLARNEIFERFLHENVRQISPGTISRFQLCHGVIDANSRSPFMDTHAAHCPFVVVKANDDDLLFERERHWVVYPEDAPEAPGFVETEPSMEIEPEGIPE